MLKEIRCDKRGTECSGRDVVSEVGGEKLKNCIKEVENNIDGLFAKLWGETTQWTQRNGRDKLSEVVDEEAKII